ncbi:lipid II:glycine glycyltransferase FemX [Thermodesulfobacteriota bacterium]
MDKIQIINPINYQNWDDLIATNSQSTFFHTLGWSKVLCESYGYKPLYFCHIGDNTIIGLIAVAEINSRLTGKRGVSLPFSDYCPPIAINFDHFNYLFKRVREYGRKAGWNSIEIRGGKKYLKNIAPFSIFKTHNLNLGNEPEKILSLFRNSTRRNIKKAKKVGVKITKSSSEEAIKEFYHLNCLTRKVHGIPPQPIKFFLNYYKHIILKKNGVVILASNSGNNIAGAVFSSNNAKAIYKYGASDLQYNDLRPNNIVMWSAIKHYIKRGFKTFSFGRTELSHSGLLQFKRGWGTYEETLKYYKYDLRKDCFVNDNIKLKSSYWIFKKMPIPILKFVGKTLYKHIG